MGILDRFRRKPTEKSWVNTDQGVMNTSWDAGWWQQDRQPLKSAGPNETVEACIATLAQTVAMCPVYHYQNKPDGEAVRLTGSTPERTLLYPNDYSSRTQFFNSIIRCMYFQGDGYAIASRNGNGSVAKLHIVDPRNMEPIIGTNGDVYYWGSPSFGREFNPETDTAHLARNVLHLRINEDLNKPLKGVTPLTAAANSMAANSSITAHQASFFANMSRPSGILSTPEKLNLEQMKQLRQALEEKSRQGNSGGVPILGNGLSFQQMSLTSQDAQMIEAFNMTVEDISRVFRVPLPMINALQNSTFNNSESMMRWFLSSGLGFLLEHIELELNKLFDLPFDQRLNFETKALLRSDWKTTIETLGEGVLKGIYSPNEARAEMRLAPVADGDEPRVQQQVVPLSAWDMEPEPEPVEETPEEVEAALLTGITKGMADAS